MRAKGWKSNSYPTNTVNSDKVSKPFFSSAMTKLKAKIAEEAEKKELGGKEKPFSLAPPNSEVELV